MKQQQKYTVFVKAREDIKLSDMVYKGGKCGLVIGIDLSSAINIVKIKLRKLETTIIETYYWTSEKLSL